MHKTVIESRTLALQICEHPASGTSMAALVTADDYFRAS